MRISEVNQRQLETMCQNLKTLRERNGITIAQLASITGIEETILTEIENNIVQDSFLVDYLFKLCVLYKVKMHQLFFSME